MITLPYGVIFRDREVIPPDEFFNSEMEAWFRDSQGQIDLLKSFYITDFFLLVHSHLLSGKIKSTRRVWRARLEIGRVKLDRVGHYQDVEIIWRAGF